MPVVVTAADCGIGPDLVAALRVDGAEVRAFAVGDGDVAALRSAGAFVAIGELDDEAHLDAAMTDAHTVIVTTDTWLADADDLVRDVDTAVSAARSAGVRRVVLVSMADADVDAGSALLRAFGEVEATLAATGMQTLAVRTDGIVEHGVLDLVSGVSNCDDEVLSPVRTAHLVRGLVALDAARSTRTGGHAVFTALGERETVAGWRRRLTGTASTPDGEPSSPGPTLVGQRWLEPTRRADLRAVLSGRGGPTRVGADLWDFTDESAP